MADWKEMLPEDVKEELRKVLEKTKSCRYAYLQSDDTRIAQLWVAIAQLSKELEEVKKLLGKVEEPFKAIVEIGEEEKRKAIARIVEEIIKPSDKETQEVTKRLVDSLMKF